MGKIEKLEQEVQALSPEELAQFRTWFLEYDWAAWDREIERDAQAAFLRLAEQYGLTPLARTRLGLVALKRRSLQEELQERVSALTG